MHGSTSIRLKSTDPVNNTRLPKRTVERCEFRNPDSQSAILMKFNFSFQTCHCPNLFNDNEPSTYPRTVFTLRPHSLWLTACFLNRSEWNWQMIIGILALLSFKQFDGPFENNFDYLRKFFYCLLFRFFVSAKIGIHRADVNQFKILQERKTNWTEFTINYTTGWLTPATSKGNGNPTTEYKKS